MTRLSQRLRSAPGDAGMGLAELLVAMAISSILLLALGTTFAGSLRSSASATTRISNTAELRLALDTVARRLRVAVQPDGQPAAFQVAGPRSVRFFASLTKPGDTSAQPPTLVEYAVVGDCLQESRTTPVSVPPSSYSWTDAAAVTRTTCLARGAVNGDGAALFTFFPTGAISPMPAVPLGDPVGGVTGTDLVRIGSVQIDLGVGSSAAGSPPAARANTRVTLVNVLAAP